MFLWQYQKIRIRRRRRRRLKFSCGVEYMELFVSEAPKKKKVYGIGVLGVESYHF